MADWDPRFTAQAPTADGWFDEPIAAGYDDSEHTMFADDQVQPAVDSRSASPA